MGRAADEAAKVELHFAFRGHETAAGRGRGPPGPVHQRPPVLHTSWLQGAEAYRSHATWFHANGRSGVLAHLLAPLEAMLSTTGNQFKLQGLLSSLETTTVLEGVATPDLDQLLAKLEGCRGMVLTNL